MKRGIIIGKFIPVHKGHLALVEFAVNQCDELIISMSHTSNDPIPISLRITWMKEVLKNFGSIKLGIIEDDFDQPDLPLKDRTLIWSSVLKEKYPPIDVVFSSEMYGDFLAKHLNATSVIFDPERTQVAISASLIRQDPFRNWKFIPEAVRPYFVKIICLYGPESTGKSSMAKHLAELYETEYVPEVAREHISSNQFTMGDIIAIGKAQTQRIKEKLKESHHFLFCDTDLITTQIYAQQYLQTVPSILYELEKEIQYNHYFLFNIDVPWVSDGLRDLGDRREEMMDIFKHELTKRNISPTLVTGNWAERESIITNKLTQLKNH